MKYFDTSSYDGNIPIKGHGFGRGYPDISLIGYNYKMVMEGKSMKNIDESPAAAVLVGFLSNINAARHNSGKGSLGWINPAIYMNSTYFVRDIISGSNLCKSSGLCCKEGFYATPGWDPVTGLGSLDYGNFHTFLLSLGTINQDNTTVKEQLGIIYDNDDPLISVNEISKKVELNRTTQIHNTSTAKKQMKIDNLTVRNLRLFQPRPLPPTLMPTADPTSIPTSDPTSIPTCDPTSIPTSDPTSIPTSDPTSIPTSDPTSIPTCDPTSIPTMTPTSTAEPTLMPTCDPTSIPTMTPMSTTGPTLMPTCDPTSIPTMTPTSTAVPTLMPTCDPTSIPVLGSLYSDQPTILPTLNGSTSDRLVTFFCLFLIKRLFSLMTSF